jgi:predicted deacylase
MKKLGLVRETSATTTRATPTLEERVAMVRAFVDAECMRKEYKPGWFEEAEEELEKKMLEIRRDLTAELIGAHDVDAHVIEIDGKPHRRVLRATQTYMTANRP